MDTRLYRILVILGLRTIIFMLVRQSYYDAATLDHITDYIKHTDAYINGETA